MSLHNRVAGYIWGRYHFSRHNVHQVQGEFRSTVIEMIFHDLFTIPWNVTVIIRIWAILGLELDPPRPAQCVGPVLIRSWANVVDAGLALDRHGTDILCRLGGFRRCTSLVPISAVLFRLYFYNHMLQYFTVCMLLMCVFGTFFNRSSDVNISN